MANKSKFYRLDNVTVNWANLFKPDEFRGQKKHDCTVVITQAQYDAMLELAGADKIAGIRVGEQGDILCKAKSTVFTRQGKDRYENCFDGEGQRMKPLIGKGDIVNMNVGVYEYTDGAFTLTLGGIQLVEKRSEFGADNSEGPAAFTAVEGGYVASSSDLVGEEQDSPAESSPASGTEEVPF